MDKGQHPNDAERSLKCSGCGAMLRFEAGSHHLKCTYCGAENELAPEQYAGEVVDFAQFVAAQQEQQGTLEQVMVKCNNCGASVDLPPSVTSDNCPFCASPLIKSMANNVRLLKPHNLLPFIIDRKAAEGQLATWAGKLWFAPSDLARTIADTATRMQGIYMPHWSYDTGTYTQYSGERGEHYYVTETYTKTVNGQTVTDTRRVQHTRWWPAWGTVGNNFIDLLVSASPTLPQEVTSVLEPWTLDKMVDFDERFLSGFRSETWQIDAVAGFEVAKRQMVPTIEQTIRSDIGGDVQRIGRYTTRYVNTGLKYILLPVWLCAYKHNGKPYRITINASTGEVTGERPYSTIKIVLACLLATAIIVAAYLYFSEQ